MAAQRANGTVSVGERMAELFPVLKMENRTCTAHGEYGARLLRLPVGERWSECPDCVQRKIDEEDEAIKREAMAKRDQIRVESMLGRACIPKRFLDRTLDNFVVEGDGQAKALRAATRYADNWKDNHAGASLIMCGTPGTGKTHLAIGIARRVLSDGGSVIFARMVELARNVRETYDKDQHGVERKRSEREVIAEYARCDMLILDEVGRQHGSDFEKMVLFDVINARYEQCRPTILITNLNLEGLRAYLDPAAEDRLREGGGRAIQFNWESYRRKVTDDQ